MKTTATKEPKMVNKKDLTEYEILVIETAATLYAANMPILSASAGDEGYEIDPAINDAIGEAITLVDGVLEFTRGESKA